MNYSEEAFTRIFVWVLAILLLFTIIIILVSRSIGLDENSGPMTDKDIDARTLPYGWIKVARASEVSIAGTFNMTSSLPVAAASANAGSAEDIQEGRALYDAACIACHGTGVAGAPIVGNAEAWKSRITSDLEQLVANAIHGKGVMPPRGSRVDYSDAQIKSIVQYMVSVSR